MNYPVLITESVDQLKEIEKQQTLALQRDRVRFLKLLKTGQQKNQQQAGQAIGLGQRQAQRLWKTYRTGGLLALLPGKPRRGLGKLSSYHISQLRAFLLADRAQTLADIQTFLETEYAIYYTIGGLSDLCKRLKIKSKTGRPVNVRQQPGAVDEFKKNGPTCGPAMPTSR